MSMNKGGPAFPSAPEYDDKGYMLRSPSGGMTLRDWFAGNVAANQMQLNDHNCNESQAKFTARWAYMVADAMLAERSKP